jgi:hypothetical protein
VQLGIRQARYCGRHKTLFQLLMAATAANLTLIATKTGQMRTKIGLFLVFSTRLEALQRAFKALGGEGWHLVHLFQPRLTAAGSKMPVLG